MKKPSKKQRILKHEPGTPNPILIQEEKSMIALVNKALASTSNAQTIGRNGEIPLRNFFNRYLPYTFRPATGHFITPSGCLSPQIDIMILDSRYPLLSENADGSVLSMLHSLIATIEVKTSLSAKDIKKMWKDSIEIMSLASEVQGYGGFKWGTVIPHGFAYGSRNRLNTLKDRYVEAGQPEESTLDICLLRLHPKDQKNPKEIGVELHFEPILEDDKNNQITEHIPTCRPSFTPLSDLYYNIVQTSYYTIGSRNYSYSDIGRHVSNYMSWATCASFYNGHVY